MWEFIIEHILILVNNKLTMACAIYISYSILLITGYGILYIEKMEYNASSQTLTCISAGSPATTVTWTRGNGEVIDDGIEFEKTQIIKNKQTSEYLNKLTSLVSDFNFAGITCQVSNSLGSSQIYPIIGKYISTVH